MDQPLVKSRWTAKHQRSDSSSDESPTPSQTGGASPDLQAQQKPTFNAEPTKITSKFEVDDSRTLTDQEDQIPVYRRQTKSQRFYGGLKRNLRMFTIAAVIILIINISWLIYARAHYGIQKGSGGFQYGTIVSSDCTSAKRANLWLHLAINIMSTLLLSGSNAFMAAYSGPTREEVDQAHSKHTWLHVQSISLRNLRGIAKRKAFVVLVLAASSTPFHLFFNSVVYPSLASNNYYWLVVTEGFLNGSSYNLTGPPTYLPGSDANPAEPMFYVNITLPDDSQFPNATNTTAATNELYQYFDNIQNTAKTWNRLDPADCIQDYRNVFLNDRRNVVVVTSTQNASNSVLNFGSADLNPLEHQDLDQNFWICSEYGSDGGANACVPSVIWEGVHFHGQSWEVFNNTVEYCLSEPVNVNCDVKFSLDLMIILLVFNILKVVAMLWILLRLDAERILTSVGDAAVSFLQHPDMSTFGMCLASKEHIKSFWNTSGVARVYDDNAHRRWGQALSKWRWIIFSTVLAGSLGAMTFFCVWGFTGAEGRGVSLNFNGLNSLGFGYTNQFTLAIFGGGGNAVTNSLLANLPQVVLGVMYLVYQGIVTAMFISADWAQFAFKPQTLMVSSPVGIQRGTWLLGAPFASGIGLLILQTALHWFVSQSLFVVEYIVYDKLGNRNAAAATYSNIGYSPWPMISTMIACVILFLTAIYFHLRRLPKGSPPVVATCTAAISASCHVPVPMREDSLAYEDLRWGVTDQPTEGIGHCSLGPAECWDDGRAGPPVNGYAYAGKEKEE